MAMHKLIKRTQTRFSEERAEERFEGLVERAIVLFRGQEYPVRVGNVSTRGTMIESDLQPRIGETIVVEFEHCSRIHAFVRWNRDGQIGLNFGQEIVLA